MKRELKDELEVPRHVILIKPMNKGEAVTGVKRILAKAETRGCSKLNELTKTEKDEINQYFDALGLAHTDLEE